MPLKYYKNVTKCHKNTGFTKFNEIHQKIIFYVNHKKNTYYFVCVLLSFSAWGAKT